MTDTAARVDIPVRRYEVARFEIAVTGVDLTGVPMAMQVRLGRDVPGAPLIELATVTTLAAQGLKLDSVTIVDGVPVSIIKGRINKTTMDALPYAGEVGDDTTLAYAMQWTLGGDAQTRLYGDLIVRASAFGSDGAPVDRPVGYGGSAPRAIATGGTLHFGDQVIQVTIAGTALLAPYLSAAAVSADRAEDARDAAQGFREDARTSATAAELAATRTAADLIQANAAAATAAAAQQAVLDNIAGIDISVGLQLQAVSVAALRAITDRSAGLQAYLSEGNRAGTFVWSTADLSAVCAIDVTMGIYIPPAGQNGSAGAWVRAVNSAQRWHGSWFGLPNAISADDGPVLRAIEALRPAGTQVKLGTGTFKAGNVKVLKPGHWGGSGKLTVMQHTGGSGVDTFDVCCKGGVRISHMRFTGLVTPDNANAHFPIYISSRFVANADATGSEDHEVDHCWFDGCSTGVRVSYAGVYDAGSRTWHTPKRTSIHHCVFSCTYQDILPESEDIHIYKCSFLRPDTADNARPFAFNLRVLGCDRVTITDCYFDVPLSAQMMGVMSAGVDANGEPGGSVFGNYRAASNVRFSQNRIKGGSIQIYEAAGAIDIVDNTFVRDTASTAFSPLVVIGESVSPLFRGRVNVSENLAYGYSDGVVGNNPSIHHLRVHANTIVGNAKGGGPFENYAVRVTVSGNDQAGNPRKPPTMIEVTDNVFALGSGALIPLRVEGPNAVWSRTRFVFTGNALPYDPETGPAAIAFASDSVDMPIYFGQPGKPQPYSAVVEEVRGSPGSNYRLDANARADLAANARNYETEWNTFPPTFP